MDGLSRTLGIGPTVELGGRKFVVRAKIVESLGLIEAEIVKRRGNPFSMIRQAAAELKECPEVLREVVANLMYEAKEWHFVTSAELHRFMYDCHDGFIFQLWCCLKQDESSLTLDEVNRLYSEEFQLRFQRGGTEAAEAFRSALERAMQQAEGEDELGNLTGSTNGPVDTQSEIKDGSTGTESGDSSSQAPLDSHPPTS